MTDTPFLTVADVARLVVMTEPYVRDKLSRQRGFPEPYRKAKRRALGPSV